MTPERAPLISSVADRIEALQVAHPACVTVDGRTASGKTTLADEIAARGADIVVRNDDVDRPSIAAVREISSKR